MKQKTAPEKLVSALLQTIDPKEIADAKRDCRRTNAPDSRVTSEPDRAT